MSGSEKLKNNQIVQVVALALKNKTTGQYLFARRGPQQSGAGEWEFPGGKVEEGETQQQALIREIKEELNFDLMGMELILVGENTHHYPSKSVQIFLWQAVIDFVPQFNLTDHDQVAWLSLIKAREISLSDGDKLFISLLK